ncbi:stress response protein nst1-like [Rhinatrema bivittatum]|uniref:stress response protein nst1-like n=1 Tax=Rhinatrema bivittatum TaxID=194408 RepID=UPI00112D528E|nr:stress response protein nst1-like [Rhinatrema bivittatum]XP_029455819.1 stress response protein nst1-like [Rhinatrema bivittatum]
MPSKGSSRKNRISISSTISSFAEQEAIKQVFKTLQNGRSQMSDHRAGKTKSRKMEEPPTKSKAEDGSREGPALTEPKLVMVVLRPFGLRILRYNPVPAVNASVQHLKKLALKKTPREEKMPERPPRVRIKKPTDSRLESSNSEALKEWLRKKTTLLRRERAAQKKQKRLERRKEEEAIKEKQLRNEESERMVRQWMDRKRQEQKLSSMQSRGSIPDKPRLPPTGRVMSTRVNPESTVSKIVRTERKVANPAESTEPQKSGSDAAEGEGSICETTIKPTKTTLVLPALAPGGNGDLCGA